MPSIKHIVFPMDFSDRSNGPVPFVAEMARRHDATVTIIAVAHPFYAGGLEGAPTIDPQLILNGVKSQLDNVYNAFLSDLTGLKVDRFAVFALSANVPHRRAQLDTRSAGVLAFLWNPIHPR